MGFFVEDLDTAMLNFLWYLYFQRVKDSSKTKEVLKQDVQKDTILWNLFHAHFISAPQYTQIEAHQSKFQHALLNISYVYETIFNRISYNPIGFSSEIEKSFLVSFDRSQATLAGPCCFKTIHERKVTISWIHHPSIILPSI